MHFYGSQKREFVLPLKLRNPEDFAVRNCLRQTFRTYLNRLQQHANQYGASFKLRSIQKPLT